MSDYRPTFFDRHGPDAGIRLRVAGWSAFVVLAGAGIGAFAASTRGASVGAALGAGVVGAGIAALFTRLLVRGLSDGAGRALGAVLQPSGASVPYQTDFSRQDAMAARGDVDGALASYEELLRGATPDDVALRLRAADLYVQAKREPARAAALYTEVQRIANVPAPQFVYATNRLVTLCLGALDDRGRAMGELRRLIDRAPESDVARHARTALANLKREAAEAAGTR